MLGNVLGKVDEGARVEVEDDVWGSLKDARWGRLKAKWRESLVAMC